MARDHGQEHAVDETTVGVGLAYELAAEELKKDYQAIRKLLQG